MITIRQKSFSLLLVILVAFVSIVLPFWFFDSFMHASGPNSGHGFTKQISAEQMVETYLKHADTLYWLGLTEKGNISAFEKAIAQIEEAEKQSAKITDKKKRERWSGLIKLQKSELGQEKSLFSHEFFGVYPLARLLIGSIYQSPGFAETYEVVQDSVLVASINAVERVKEAMSKHWKNLAQINVVLNQSLEIPKGGTKPTKGNDKPASDHGQSSDSKDKPEEGHRLKAVTNKLRFILNTDPKFFLHTKQKITSILVGGAVEKMWEDDKSPLIQKEHLDKLGFKNLLVLTVEGLDSVGRVDLLELTGRFYQLDSQSSQVSIHPTATIKSRGLCRDRHLEFKALHWLTGGLFILCIALFLIVRSVRDGTFGLASTSVLIWCLLAFVIARLLPIVLLPGLSSLLPSAESPASLYWWYPALVGLVVFAVPSLLGLIALYRMPWLNMHSLLVCWLLLVSTQLGVVAYLIGPVLIFQGLSSSMYQVLSLVAGAMGLATLTAILANQALNRRMAKLGGICLVAMVILSALMGLILCSQESVWYWAYWGIFALSVVAWISLDVILGSRGALTKRQRRSEKPANLGALRAALANPIYQNIRVFDEVIANLEGGQEGRSNLILLQGRAGMGKSRLLNELIYRYVGEEGNLVLFGECVAPLPGQKQPPFAPFLKAFSNFGAEAIALAQSSKVFAQGANQLIGGLFDVLPGGGILHKVLTGDLIPGEQESYLIHEKTLFKEIAELLQRMDESTNKRVLLLLDDVHFMDHASLRLFGFLLEEVRARDLKKLYVILASGNESGDSQDAANLMKDHQAMSTELPRAGSPWGEKYCPMRQMAKEIMVESLNIAKNTADRILAVLLNLHWDKSVHNLGWILSYVRFLLSKGLLRLTHDNKFAISPYQALPLPDYFSDRLRDINSNLSEEESFIVAMASIFYSKRFDTSILSKGIKKDHMEVIKKCSNVEKTTDLIRDIWIEENVFAFRSVMVRSWYRDSIFQGYHRAKLSPHQVPQLAREFHKLFVPAFEERDLDKIENLKALAHHTYWAGLEFAAQAAEYCHHAAEVALRDGDHASAMMFADRSLGRLNHILLEDLDSRAPSKKIQKELEAMAEVGQISLNCHFILDITLEPSANVANDILAIYKNLLMPPEMEEEKWITLCSLANIQYYMGEPWGSVSSAQEALDICTSLDDLIAEAKCLVPLALGYSRTKGMEVAMSKLEEAENLFDNYMRSKPEDSETAVTLKADICFARGQIYLESGDLDNYPKAAKQFQDARNLREQNEGEIDLFGIALCDKQLADLSLKMGEYENFAEYIEEAEVSFKSPLAKRQLLELGNLYMAMADKCFQDQEGHEKHPGIFKHYLELAPKKLENTLDIMEVYYPLEKTAAFIVKHLAELEGQNRSVEIELLKSRQKHILGLMKN